MEKGNLLIVDDEEMILKSLSISLRGFADHIFTATNGVIALEIIKKESIQMVISDIKMPEMNGLIFIQKLREMGNNVPLAFFTGHGNRELLEKAINFGAYDFIDKPAMDRLEEVVISGLEYSKSESLRLPWGTEDQISDFHDLLINQIKK